MPEHRFSGFASTKQPFVVSGIGQFPPDNTQKPTTAYQRVAVNDLAD